jgi:hypothetical protein
MVEPDREHERHDKQHRQHVLVIGTQHEQTEETEHEDHELRDNYVCQYRADKEPVLALEQRQTDRAVMPDVKGALDDRRLATRRTAQFHAAFKYPDSLFGIQLHSGAGILSRLWAIVKGLTGQSGPAAAATNIA